MRKVYFKMIVKTMVPVISTYNMIVNVDEGVGMDKVTKAVIKGVYPSNMTLEDSGISNTSVEKQDNGLGLSEQVIEYITSHSQSEILEYEVTDSK